MNILLRVLKWLAIATVALITLCVSAFVLLAFLVPGKKEAPPSLPFLPFGDNQAWVLMEDMVYRIGTTGVTITVPMGFVTDFASIPRTLWSLGLSPHGQYSRAAVVHDYLYWTQACSQQQADRLLLIAMKESAVSGFDEWAIYSAVATFGAGPMASNRQERKSGLPRVIPEAQLRPADPNMAWPEYRNLLVQQGVKDPPFEENPPYCQYGNSTEVPTAASTAQVATSP